MFSAARLIADGFDFGVFSLAGGNGIAYKHSEESKIGGGICKR